MNIDALKPDLGELEKTRGEFYFLRGVLKDAVHHYASDALEAAADILDVAVASGPMVDTYMPFANYRKSTELCYKAIKAARMVNIGILKLEETSDTVVDVANEEFKTASLEMNTVNAKLEGASNRIELASNAFPESPLPGARCNGGVFEAEPQSDEDGI